MDELIGKSVLSFGYAMNIQRRGQIIAEESTRWGEAYIIAWEDRKVEPFFKHQIKSVKEKNGIGVYYED
ncbi:hypothetical protein [Paenibacillus chitinolyticus]|uniref:hypothetical protein n=1 Tax=Paenibacillus chitinolyticus TaxID=79263 RepID=UPI001C463B46|nr:hypothetical protein [Paenibacillus chitinolyticus]MBV6717278.1 hypothetical protein [Paenibacillus chitinolyticus]